MLIRRFIIAIVICSFLYLMNMLSKFNDKNCKRVFHKASINKIKQQIKRSGPSIAPPQLEAYFYKLHELYYNGIPDKYDTNGNKIKGVEPDPNKSLYYISKAIACRDNPNLWFVMGSIYQNGMYNMEPELESAAHIYNYIYTKYPSVDISASAWDEYNNTIHQINTIKTYNWLNLKYTAKKNEHHEKIKKLFQKVDANPFTQIKVNTHNFFRSDVNNTPVNNVNIELDIDDHRRNDMHNTHNSQVVSTVANSIKKLKEITPITSPLAQTIHDIRHFIMSKPVCDRRDDALKSLDSIERNILPISSVDMKETEVLNIIWNRISSNEHIKNQEDIKNILYDQLADMQEHGKSVCPTGRVERLVDSLNTFDESVSIKPTYIINQEMINKAEHIRNEMYQNIRANKGEQEVQKYQNGTGSDQEQFDINLKNEILRQLEEDYVKTGIVTDNKFRSMINKWIDHI